jgi:hypothetical protein
MIRILAFWLMGSYVVGVYLAGAALEYCLKDWELVMHLTGVHLSQTCISHRHVSFIGARFSQICISHRHVSLIGVRLTGIHLSQACISHRHTSPTGMYLL